MRQSVFMTNFWPRQSHHYRWRLNHRARERLCLQFRNFNSQSEYDWLLSTHTIRVLNQKTHITQAGAKKEESKDNEKERKTLTVMKMNRNVFLLPDGCLPQLVLARSRMCNFGHHGARLFGLPTQSLVGRLRKRIHVFERINFAYQCTFCHIYCAQIVAPWGKIAWASCAVSSRQTARTCTRIREY